MIVDIYTDGASRGNPGKSASGYALYNQDGVMLLHKSFYNGIRTNNEAEYLAIIAALDVAASEYGYDAAIRLHSDSELAIRQLSGGYRVRSEKLRKLNEEASTLLSKFPQHSLENVPRENVHISEVDAELNRLLDRYE